MTIFFHELRQHRLALILWTAILAFMLGLCVWIYPMMENSMGELEAMVEQMGELGSLMGGSQLAFSDFFGYFGMECEEILGIGGALFAGLTAAAALSKEEKEHTAEFLLTHPVSRARVVTEKLLALLVEILVLNVVVALVSILSAVLMNISVDTGKLALLFLSYTLLQWEIGSLCFGLSACLKRGSVGAGLGMALLMYAIHLLSQLTESLKFLKNLTPFGFADVGYLVTHSFMPWGPLVIGALLTAGGIFLSYFVYTKKDIA